MIRKEDIELLKSRIRIEDVMSHFGIKITKKGARLYGLCPFHDDHHPSLCIDAQKNMFYCPVCHEHGDAISFVQKHKGISYIEALKVLSQIFGVELREEVTDTSNQKDLYREEWVRNMRRLVLDTSKHYLFETDNEAYRYLRSRGLTDETIETYQLGFLPDLATLSGKARQLLTFKEAERMQNRIIFPWFSSSNQLIGLAGRVVDARTKGIAEKYTNSSFPKGNYFYGWYEAIAEIRKTKEVYIVEGYTDVMAMHQSGIYNVVAQCGTALTERHAYMLASCVNKVILCLDNDSPGIIAMDRAAHKLLPYNLQVELLLSSEGKDPADMLFEHGESYVLEWSKFDTINILDMCIQRIKATPIVDTFILNAKIRQLLEYLSLISDDIIRGLYVAKCNEIIPEIGVQSLLKAIK